MLSTHLVANVSHMSFIIKWLYVSHITLLTSLLLSSCVAGPCHFLFFIINFYIVFYPIRFSLNKLLDSRYLHIDIVISHCNKGSVRIGGAISLVKLSQTSHFVHRLPNVGLSPVLPCTCPHQLSITWMLLLFQDRIKILSPIAYGNLSVACLALQNSTIRASASGSPHGFLCYLNEPKVRKCPASASAKAWCISQLLQDLARSDEQLLLCLTI